MYLFLNCRMSQILLVIQLLNPCGKICLWAWTSVINVSVATNGIALTDRITQVKRRIQIARYKYNPRMAHF